MLKFPLVKIYHPRFFGDFLLVISEVIGKNWKLPIGNDLPKLGVCQNHNRNSNLSGIEIRSFIFFREFSVATGKEIDFLALKPSHKSESFFQKVTRSS